jgi:hypothetical protein
MEVNIMCPASTIDNMNYYNDSISTKNPIDPFDSNTDVNKIKLDQLYIAQPVVQTKTFTDCKMETIDDEVNEWLLEQFKNKSNTGFELLDIKAYEKNLRHVRCIIYRINIQN